MTRRFAHLVLTSPFIVAAALAACSSSTDGGGGGNPPPAPDVRIVPGASILGFQAYSPDTVTASLGGAASVTLTWRNDEPANSGQLHTVTDTTGANAFNTGNISPGGSKSLTFATAGSYPYKCNNHLGMRGLVIVQP